MDKQQAAKSAIAKTLAYIESELEEITSKPNWTSWSIRLYCDWCSPKEVMAKVAREAGVSIDSLDAAPAETDWEALASNMGIALYHDYKESVEYDSEPGCNGNGNASDTVDHYLSWCLQNEAKRE